IAAAPRDSLQLDRTSVALALTGHVSVVASVRNAGGSTGTAAVTWTSDNAAVSVSPQGMITGVSIGRATVTAHAGELKASVAVVVLNGAPGGVAMIYDKPTLALSQSVRLQVYQFDAAGVGTLAN